MFLKRHFVHFAFLIVQFLGLTLIAEEHSQRPLFIRIIYESGNVSGQYKDFQILKRELNNLGCIVEGASDNILETPPQQMADINIFIELPSDGYLPYAHENYLIPNPECFWRFVGSIPKFNKILCRTQDVMHIFSPLHPNLYFLGFTSEDHLRKNVKKKYSLMWHAPGKSVFKNTEAVVKLWEKRKDFPPVTIVHRLKDMQYPQNSLQFPKNNPLITNISRYMEEAEFYRLQNMYGIHLCPSLAEGFGHYIMEAMSTGAVVITTNAPPMNEFIKDKRCLISFSKKKRFRLGFLYYVDLKDFERVIDRVRALPKKQLKRIGKLNRQFYLHQTEIFKKQLSKLIKLYQKKRTNPSISLKPQT